MYPLEPDEIQALKEPEEKTQGDMIEHIILKVPITKALANRVLQEVLDFITIMLLFRHTVYIPRLGKFSYQKIRHGPSQIIFEPALHMQKLVNATIKTEAHD